MLSTTMKNKRNNKILYSNNDRSDIIPANTAYLGLQKIYIKGIGINIFSGIN